MSIFSFLHTQYPAAQQPVDESIFHTAALVFTNKFLFDAPVEAVFTALDDDHGWEWLPTPCVGVVYESAEREPGMIREMGWVRPPLRFLGIQREQFFHYEPFQRIAYGVVTGSWTQYLTVRQYAESMTFTPTQDGRTELEWTVAVTLRLPLRFLHWFPPVWRGIYRLVGAGPLFRRRLAEIVRTTPSPTSANTTATATDRPTKEGVK